MSDTPLDSHITLRQYLEKILELQQLALTKEARVLDARLEHLNELRGNVVTKGEYTTGHQVLDLRISQLEKWQSKLIGIGLMLVLASGIAGGLIAKIVLK